MASLLALAEAFFIAEGTKLTKEILLSDLITKYLIATEEWFIQNAEIDYSGTDTIVATEHEIKQISSLTTPQPVLCIAEIPRYDFNYTTILNQLSIYFDEIQDPGNVGTIIRIADWFGIQDIFYSTGTVDIYNSKVLQATMGAICRVRTHKVDSNDFFKTILVNKHYPVYGTFLEGNSIYEHPLSSNGLIIMGNEGVGISKNIEPYINYKLFIPGYPPGSPSSESLNVSTATAIVCSEFRQRIIYPES